jgi:energy-coupling factor transport system ATP-binding protein
LQVNALQANYGDHVALKGVSFTVGASETVALMGRNGAGKSTLLKSIVGLIQPGGGDILVNGTSVKGQDTAEICRDVAYLPQNPNALLFADSVAAELNITLANHGLSGTKDVLALLKQLGLERYAQYYPRDLSVGERERVAVGAVTITEPKLLLLDEPTRGLDYGSKRALAALLARWKADGAGILLVSHDVEFVAECADRVVMLSEGQVIAEGDPARVLGASPIFAPQVAQAFPGMGWLTVADVVQALSTARN